MPYYVPTVIEKSHRGERAYDIYSRLLMDESFSWASIDDQVANAVIAHCFLAARRRWKGHLHVINSPGGEAAGMAIYDTMQYVKPDVHLCVEGCFYGSVASVRWCNGKRACLQNSRVMIQALGGSRVKFWYYDRSRREHAHQRDDR